MIIVVVLGGERNSNLHSWCSTSRMPHDIHQEIESESMM